MDNIHNDTVDNIKESNTFQHKTYNNLETEDMTDKELIDDLTRNQRNFKITYANLNDASYDWKKIHFKFVENAKTLDLYYKQDKINLNELTFKILDDQIILEFHGIIKNEEYQFEIRFIKNELSKKYFFTYFADAQPHKPKFHHTSKQGGGRE